jgi:hypothetical protein
MTLDCSIMWSHGSEIYEREIFFANENSTDSRFRLGRAGLGGFHYPHEMRNSLERAQCGEKR